MDLLAQDVLFIIQSRLLVICIVLLSVMTMVFTVVFVVAQWKLKESYSNVLYSLAFSLEARDRYSAGHSTRVAELSKQLAIKMGLKKKMVETIYRAGILHDIGKIAIPDSVLLKKTKLNLQDMVKISEHPLFASSILKAVEKFYKNEIKIIEAHHERWDGEGYPLGIKQHAIPLGAQIIAVADTYDAITSDRPYREALSMDDALIEISMNSGSQFNPLIVDQFVALFEDKAFKIQSNEDISEFQIGV